MSVLSNSSARLSSLVPYSRVRTGQRLGTLELAEFARKQNSIARTQQHARSNSSIARFGRGIPKRAREGSALSGTVRSQSSVQSLVMCVTSNLDSKRMEPISQDFLRDAITSVWRQKLVVLVTTAAALAFGIVAIFLVPPRYTALAYVNGKLAAPSAPYVTSKEDESVRTGSVNLDVQRLIETQSRLLQSQQMARKVVDELGLQRLQPIVSKAQWLPAGFYRSPAKTSGDERDIAAARLLRDLSVESDRISYLIAVRFTASDAELAKLLANTFVAELVRSTSLQALSQQSVVDHAVLSNKLAKFGDKHPGVAQARMQVAATDDLMKEQRSEIPEAILQAAGGNVTEAIVALSSPNPRFIISLFLLIGFTVGAAIALWLGRDRRSKASFPHYAAPLA